MANIDSNLVFKRSGYFFPTLMEHLNIEIKIIISHFVINHIINFLKERINFVSFTFGPIMAKTITLLDTQYFISILKIFYDISMLILNYI